MSVRALAHICVHVKNLEDNRKFYCDILGFQKLFDFTKNGEVAGFYLGINRHNYMEFFKDSTKYANHSPMKHFCLETKKIEKMREKLTLAGIETTEIKLGCDNTYQFWFKDPNGIDVEFHQYTRKSSQKTRKDVEIDW